MTDVSKVPDDFDFKGNLRYCSRENLAKDLSGRIAVVTGASSGIGRCVAAQLVKQSCKVFLAARDVGKLNKIAAELGENAEVLQVDFTDLVSVKQAAQELIAKCPRLDYLVNNAGTFNHPFARTKQGFEMQFGVNHLGGFLFTHLLTPLLIKSSPSRVVMTSTALHYATGAGGSKERTLAYIDWEDWNWNTRKFDRELAFSQAMLANVMWAREYADRYGKQGVTAVSIHPGCVDTNAQRHMVGEGCWGRVVKRMLKYGIRMIDTWPGSQTTLHAVLADSVSEHSGEHYAQSFSPHLPFKQPVYERLEQDAGGWPMEEPSNFARNPENLKRLWSLSEDAVKEYV
eukprot:TRINITY_DN21207_c0_g1_i1.p1 TRINITY_DN21207_c0_g1~~TRINITY_DN21207_c0_g1_i1.p1  ORF type:complete len:343 (+),score=41.42 TRINITY_DN21207_c0_g1_i1:41-1069(+)